MRQREPEKLHIQEEKHVINQDQAFYYWTGSYTAWIHYECHLYLFEQCVPCGKYRFMYHPVHDHHLRDHDPLTYLQQKFSKLSARMNPELQKIQKKYKGKQDQASMMKMNEETKEVYAKYGVSPTGSCIQMLIQLPILFALYRVIWNVPAYVGSVKNAFMPLVEKILATSGSQKISLKLQSK